MSIGEWIGVVLFATTVIGIVLFLLRRKEEVQHQSPVHPDPLAHPLNQVQQDIEMREQSQQSESSPIGSR